MSKKVLLIEDDKIVRENTTEILELANYKVKSAENGKIGVTLAKSFIPDIIICDIMMPVLDGYGVLQIVSKISKLEQIPFIFLTAKTHHEDLRKGMELGADDYINKPFEESELLREIETRLRRAEAFDNKIQLDKNLSVNHSNSVINIKDFDHFLSQKEVFKYKNGETIYCEGNQSNFIFFIQKGAVKTYKNNSLGKELITEIYSDNQYFGYDSFIKNKPYFDNSKAITNTSLFKINKDEITSIINNNHHIIFNLIDVLVTDSSNYKNKMLLLAYSSVRKKTAESLIYLLHNYPVKSNMEIIISRSNLANYVGIAKETLIRTLHDFKEENLIDFSSKSVLIIDERKLQKIQ